MTRGRSDGTQKKRLIATICVVAIFLGFLYAYYGSIFGNQDRGAFALQHGSKSLSHYLMGNEDSEESTTSTEQDDAEDGVVPKSYPVSNCVPLFFLPSTFNTF